MFNPDFAGAANALHSGGVTPNAAYLITSYIFAVKECGLNTTPAAWGKQQADWYMYLLRSVYSGPVGFLFADMETYPGSNNACGTDLTGWVCDTGADNVAVVNAFETEISTAYLDGLYTSTAQWGDIPGLNSGGNPNLGTSLIWMADYTASTASSQEQFFTSRNYTIYSWQYGNNSPCGVSYGGAQSAANGADPAIPRFDIWTTDPQQVC